MVGGVSVVAAVLLIILGHGVARIVGGYLLAEGIVCLLFILVERSRYQPRASRRAALRPTGERMIDPTSGKLIEVWEDPATGEREYRPVANR